MSRNPAYDKCLGVPVLPRHRHACGIDETRLNAARVIDKGRTWVKLSGAYADTAVARAYANAAPERCVWGSDWPHPTEQSKQLPDDALLFDLLTDWCPMRKCVTAF